MKKIAVFGQLYKNEHQPYLVTLLTILNEFNVEVVINEQYWNDALNEIDDVLKFVETYHDLKQIAKDVDLLVTLGGDGTILRVFEFYQNIEIPILGINLGRLGFLATVQKNEIKEAIDALITKQFRIEQRVMLLVESNEQAGEFVKIGYALNDVTISKKDTNAMIGVEAYLNNEYLTTYYADGLIVSTPTGSTGYSLSCQGPVMMPNTGNFLITPVAPHNLNARPIVIDDQTVVQLKVLRREDQFLASLDAMVKTINVETTIRIQKAPFKARIILLEGQSFIDTLRDKLLWGHDKRTHLN